MSGEMRGKHLHILSDDPLYPRIEVGLAGEIVQSMILLPDVIQLGALDDPESRRPSVVRVRPGPGMSVEVVRWSVQPADLFAATAAEAEGGMDFEIRLKDDATGTGRLGAWLEVHAKVSGEGFAERRIERVVRIHGTWPPR
jgi:hypothetical protein